MDQKIKNFDRTIEQKLNEAEVAPPFGMWNRISGELDVAETLPTAAAAVAPIAAVSKRAAIRFIVAASLISSSLVTAYIVNSLNHKNESQQYEKAVLPANIRPAISNVVSSSNTAVTEEYPVVASTSKKTYIPKLGIKVNIATTETTAASESSPSLKTIANQVEVAVPNSTVPFNTQGVSEAYYFPPVDAESYVSKNSNVVTSVDLSEQSELLDKNAEKKISRSTSSSSSSSDKRVKIKRHRRSGFSYGSLNRLSKHRSKY